MNRVHTWLSVIAVLFAGGALSIYLRGRDIPILDPKGPVALGERNIIVVTVLLCAIVVIPVFVMLFLFAWKYRADTLEPPRERLPDWDIGPMIEFLWWLVPTAIIGVLAILAWYSSQALDPYKPLQGSGEPITVEVVALDWKWLFIYPAQGIASVNLLEFPENSPVHFELTADAPMNSFWIPSLGGQIMVMPGMQTQLNLLASSLGTFNGFSGNISGEGFSGMAFTVKSVSAQDFAQWVASVQQSSNPLDTATYAALTKPSQYNPVSYYAPINQDLYTATMMQFMMPGTAPIQRTPIASAPALMPTMPGMPAMPMILPTSTTLP